MFTQDQPVIIRTALGGNEHARYKQELAAIPGAHEVWVDNMPSRSRIVRTSQISDGIVFEGKPWWWDTERCPNCKTEWIMTCGCPA